MKVVLHAPLLAALFILSAPLAMAQEGPGKPCKADHEKLCAGLKGPDAGKCMKDHEAELSDECKAARAEAQEARKNVRMNCKADIDKFCADAPKEHGGAIKCLQGHASELVQSCSDALQAMPGAKKS